MKKIVIFSTGCCLLLLAAAFSGCYKLQKDYDRDPHTLDPHIYKSAWQYLNDRANGSSPNDTIFRRMLQGIQYAEIDSNVYKQQGKTYIFLHNDAIRRLASNVVQPDCFFGANLVAGVAATGWDKYPKDFVRNYFLYLILDSVYDHYTLPPVDILRVETAAPAGSLAALPAGVTRNTTFPFTANATSEMKIQVLNSSPSNTSDYPIVLNETRNVRTSSILATNGTIHVIDRFLTTTVLP